MGKRVLFARIGWMPFYAGAQDARPIGGGKYNKEHIGSELFHFKPKGKLLYGFVKGGSRSSTFNLKRIDPGAYASEILEHVTVVFVAKDPDMGGQRVVGWYKNATVYRTWGERPFQPSYEKRVAYCIKASCAEARLVPTTWRTQHVPRGRGGMGQSNVCYAFLKGKAAFRPWMLRILKYIEEYSGPNLLKAKDRSVEAEKKHPSRP